MNTSVEFILFLSLFITLIMTLVTYISNRKLQKRELNHLTEFWASLFVNVSFYLLIREGEARLIGLSMLGWIWPLRATKLVFSDLAGANVMHRWQFYVMSIGAFLSLALSLYGESFTAMTLPFALCVGGLSLYSLYRTYSKLTPIQRTPLMFFTLGFFGLLFLERLSFPFWRMSPAQDYGFTLTLLSILGISVVILAGIFHDQIIKQTLVTEDLMNDRNQKLLGQSKFSELGMMSAGIAHEINNPLAVIQARTTQLLRIYRDPERQKDLADGLQQILYTSERINRTIQGVREFVHQDEKGPMTEIALKDLFDDVLAFCGQRMKNHGINLRFYGLEKFSVVGNKIQLEQIVLNLLNNSFDAIEYLPDKWIEVSCHPHEERIRIYFKDSGSGIPEEISTRMMDPFFSTKDLGKGTGLGLALARGIAEKHRGSLQYLTDCSHTTFLLELPVDLTQEWGNSLH